MLKSYKSRSIDTSKPVKVYRNLNNQMLSVVQNGLVVAHATEVALVDVKFIVNESGRQRVLQEKRKNVHAYVVGYLTEDVLYNEFSVTYNPFLFNSFVKVTNKRPLKEAVHASIYANGKIFAKGGK